MIKKGNHLVREHIVQRFDVALLHFLGGRVIIDFTADRPTVFPVIRLKPPAVEDAAMQSSIDSNFLSARAAGFKGAAGCIEPNITSGNKMASDIHVVIFQEDHFTVKRRLAGHLYNLPE